jgi:hypothetical protein
MPEYETLTAALLVVAKGESLYHTTATRIEIDDEAAGEFVILRQDDRTEEGIAINPEEWPTLRAAIDQMIARCRP